MGNTSSAQPDEDCCLQEATDLDQQATAFVTLVVMERLEVDGVKLQD